MKIRKRTIIYLILFTIIILLFNSFKGPSISYDEDIILKNESSYTNIAKICYEDYCKYNTNRVYSYYVDIKNKQIVCYSSDKRIRLNNIQLNDYVIIQSTYKLDKHSLSRIYAYDTFVSFGIENGRASFIYSANKKKPKYINTPNDDKKSIYVEKITDHWYYACTKYY